MEGLVISAYHFFGHCWGYPESQPSPSSFLLYAALCITSPRHVRYTTACTRRLSCPACCPASFARSLAPIFPARQHLALISSPAQRLDSLQKSAQVNNTVCMPTSTMGASIVTQTWSTEPVAGILALVSYHSCLVHPSLQRLLPWVEHMNTSRGLL